MQDVVQYQLGFDHADKLKNLVSETWNAAVLDSGATNTVPGKICFICYINPLRPALWTYGPNLMKFTILGCFKLKLRKNKG